MFGALVVVNMVAMEIKEELIAPTFHKEGYGCGWGWLQEKTGSPRVEQNKSA